MSDVQLSALSPYKLAMEFRAVAAERCASWSEADRRQRRLDRIAAEMDARDVRLEDWASR